MTHHVTIAETGHRFAVEDDETVLTAAMRQDIVLMHDCTYGGCGTCRIKLLEGSVDYEDWPFALGEDEAAAGHALACQAQPKSDLVISAKLRPEGWIAPDLYLATVTGVDRLSHDVAHLRLSVPEAAGIAYHPGQYLNVMLDDGQPRSFSMASPPADGAFDFHIRKVPGGRFTESLFGDVAVGDELEVELPHGEFRFQSEPGRKILMVAGGTGLAPIKSILEARLAAGDLPETMLYWGVRSTRDLYLNDMLETWARTVPGLTYVPVLSIPDGDWAGRTGFVHEAVAQDFASLRDMDAYLCGPPPMIAAAREGFAARGLPADRIFADSFNFTHEIRAA